MSAQTVSLIRTDLLRRGKGVEDDPVRIVTQYWTWEGELVAEVDPLATRLHEKAVRDAEREAFIHGTGWPESLNAKKGVAPAEALERCYPRIVV